MVKDLETKFKYPIAGSLRIGEKNEKNIPQRLNYFTVHEDSHTIPNVVEQFKSKYDKPTELIIKFLTDDPFETSYLRYGKSGLLCKGNGESAICKGEKEWTECACSKECEHRGVDCKLTGRLYFIIKGLNIGGFWRLQTHGSNTIDQILMTLNFLKCMGVDIKQKEFRLATEEKTSIVNGKVNKYTTVNLKMIESSESKTNVEKEQTIPEENKTENTNQIQETNETKTKEVKLKETKAKKEKKEDKKEEKIQEHTNIITKPENNEIKQVKETSNPEDEFEKCLTLVEIKDLTKGEKKAKLAKFCTMNDELIDVLIHPSIEAEVAKWQIASVILPTDLYEQNNYKILKEYKDMGIIKKAV